MQGQRPSVKKPSGLVRVDGKWPDSSTLIPWHAGKAMASNVTVINTLAESHVTLSASPGGAAEHAVARKSAKYSSHVTYIFQPLALETLGPINSTEISFLTELGRKLIDVSRDCRETTYLFQRISLAVSALIRWPPKEPLQFLLNFTSATPATWFLFLTFVFNPWEPLLPEAF